MPFDHGVPDLLRFNSLRRQVSRTPPSADVGGPVAPVSGELIADGDEHGGGSRR